MYALFPLPSYFVLLPLGIPESISSGNGDERHCVGTGVQTRSRPGRARREPPEKRRLAAPLEAPGHGEVAKGGKGARRSPRQRWGTSQARRREAFNTDQRGTAVARRAMRPEARCANPNALSVRSRGSSTLRSSPPTNAASAFPNAAAGGSAPERGHLTPPWKSVPPGPGGAGLRGQAAQRLPSPGAFQAQGTLSGGRAAADLGLATPPRRTAGRLLRLRRAGSAPDLGAGRVEHFTGWRLPPRRRARGSVPRYRVGARGGACLARGAGLGRRRPPNSLPDRRTRPFTTATALSRQLPGGLRGGPGGSAPRGGSGSALPGGHGPARPGAARGAAGLGRPAQSMTCPSLPPPRSVRPFAERR